MNLVRLREMFRGNLSQWFPTGAPLSSSKLAELLGGGIRQEVFATNGFGECPDDVETRWMGWASSCSDTHTHTQVFSEMLRTGCHQSVTLQSSLSFGR